MYSVLSEGLKYRLLKELREFWAKDPKYRDSLVPNIQGKYSFEERPQQAIILKSASGSPVIFSADHFQGTVLSYCHLVKVYNKPGTSLEWVREDSRAIRKNQGEFPSLPGLYYLEVRTEDVDYMGEVGPHLVFYVDPLLDVVDERASRIDPRTYELTQGGYHPGSLRLYEMPGNTPLYEGVQFSADPTTGQIQLTEPLPPKTYLSVDYSYAGVSTGPFLVPENGSDNNAIPGVVLAFGRRAQEGDVMVVVVSEKREEAAREYGGRWDMSMDFDIVARDVHAQGEIADRTVMYLWTELRDRLSYEGIEITQVSPGGESEEPYDENGDDYFYNATISLSLSTDWAIYIPLSRTVRRIIPNSLSVDKVVSGLSDEQLLEMRSPTSIRLTDNLGLVAVSDPWFRDRSKSFEVIR